MAEFINSLVESSLLWQSMVGTILIGLNFTILGTTLVEKRLSLVADTFSHGILPGVVLSFWIWGATTQSLLLGGWVSGAILGTVAYWISRKPKVPLESSFAFLAAYFIAGGLLLSYKTSTSSEILHLLLGNVLAFDMTLLYGTVTLTAITWITFGFARHIWSLWILDPDFYFQPGPRLAFLKLAGPFLFITNLTLGLYAMGALMTVGLLIIPALTAQLFCIRLYNRIVMAGFTSCVYSVLGFSFSYRWDWPLGPSLVFTAGTFYLTGLVVKPYLSTRWLGRSFS